MLRKTTLILLFNALSCSAFSQISWVTSLEDDTIQGTLRYAINHSTMGADIRFADTLFGLGSDTIFLDSTIYIKEAISIRGYMRNGDTLFVSGGSTNKIFDVALSYASASNGSFTLDSMALIDGFSILGGAIELHFLGLTNITNCYFKNNSSIYGGGVIDCDLVGTTNFLAHLNFENNTFIENAGPDLIRISDVEEVRMNLIYIRNNNSEHAVRAFADKKIIATKFYVTDNYKVNPFGANMLLTLGADSLLTDSLLVMNNTEAGAFSFGGYYQHHKNLFAINNTQQYGAGALDVYWYYTAGEPPLFENCIFKYNNAGNAGAIRATSLTMKNSIIRGNVTDYAIYGQGAIECAYSAHRPLSFMDCVIDSNITTQGLGGAIYGDTKHLYLERVSIYHNDGGIYGGGVVINDCDSVTILNSYIGDNTSDVDAGIKLPSRSFARIKNTTICNNSATQGSGGLHTQGNLEISGTLILDNTPTNLGTNISIPTFVSNGYNLIAQNLPLSGFQPTDIINPPATVTAMSPLTDNGGVGLTRMPLVGNIALNQGNPSDTTDAFNSSISDGRRDIGAVESSDTSIQSYSVIDICDSTLLNGAWVKQTGYYIDSAKSALNTDSIAIIKINQIHPSIHMVDVQNSCDSLIWLDGQTYYSDNNTATVKFTSQHGCDSIITLNFTKTIIDTSLTVTSSQIELSSTNALIQWYSCDSTLKLIPNANNRIFTPSSSGSYLAVLERNGCSDTTRCTQFISYLTMNGLPTVGDINLFPNPTTDRVSISWTVLKEPKIIRIVRMDGQLIKEVDVNPGQTAINLDLANMSVGSYFVLFCNQSGVYKRIFVIKE